MKKLLLNSFAEEVSIHTDIMTKYLYDSYDSIADYADGSKDMEIIKPVTLRWEWTGGEKPPEEYTVLLSENEDMSGAMRYTAEKEFCDIYNLKVNTKYYWTVSAKCDGGVISRIETFKTEKKAPRIIYAGGVKNIRDIGGWDTVDGVRVKQGYLYRSFMLCQISDGILKKQIDDSGIDTMRNTLGIKSEIDIRCEDEMPIEYTKSVLGEDINYYRIPIQYGGDCLTSNKAAIKKFFSEISDSKNYPIVYHCVAGADRTAILTYLINGLLDVCQEDLLRDYLITNFSNVDGNPRAISGIENRYVAVIDTYRGEDLSKKIYNYLSEVVGVPTHQLDFIIAYLKD